ncbi:hypothetical protein [Streptomyces sp. SID11385]|uniref:hypothetical protein n=1 Tax=Streptomyces sp. SID11385 TaxID=2706031 RepID=UPI0013C6F091|nr:hypothetical protein [Streptomyces sp. SID11385]NEA39283.1 hypothetical protein [Streptomyces sp. SID11385]
MYAAAEDDAERARIRTALYAPPRGERGPRRRRAAAAPAGAGASTSVLLAQLAAEDEQVAGMRQGSR